ncbi:negative regulator of systemic acquired resistance SNI1-like [Magnolia sinica]|uniref:negative regulator of systemic acquired resistance SNI1-like n=1 Tax=Magnolia sinica TaxID=86752 RepID=UPI00265B0A9C|nr:negative regulator of systemic acquired resistance SNI1-like [Magnolia sinica]
MAIIDSSGVRDARDVEEDRLSFLEAVRSSSIVSENGSVPTGSTRVVGSSCNDEGTHSRRRVRYASMAINAQRSKAACGFC